MASHEWIIVGTLAALSSLGCGADGGSGAGTESDPVTDSTATGVSTLDSSEGGTTTNPSASSDSGQPATSSTTASGSESGTSEETGSSSSDAREWILAHFAEDPVVTGDFDERTRVEAPALVFEATGTNAKYAFETVDDEAPMRAEVGFVDVSITDLVSSDAFGGAIQTGNGPGMILYIDDMYVEPNWPMWRSYDTTNYDGIVLDDSAEFYAEDLTIVSWNADSAIDIKAQTAQLVRLQTEGGGNRTLRFWRTGPHYIVESSVNNPSGTVLWFSDCDGTTLNVYASTFNGAREIADGDVDCDNGSQPNIVYLDTDPRTTGEMHPMFGP